MENLYGNRISTLRLKTKCVSLESQIKSYFIFKCQGYGYICSLLSKTQRSCRKCGWRWNSISALFSLNTVLWYRAAAVQFSSVTQSCPTLCDPMDCSTPGFPVHHQLPELAQTHVHWVSEAIQPSHPLSSPSPPAFHLSQHQGLFQ